MVYPDTLTLRYTTDQKYEPKPSVPLGMLPFVPGRKYGIVKVSKEWPAGEWNATITASAQPMQDRPIGIGKGNTIPIFDNWWIYLEKINTHPKAMEFWRSVGWLWINIPYLEEGKTPRAESVMSCSNIVSWDEEIMGHARLLSFPWDMDTTILDPRENNWWKRPDLFWKACSYNLAGNVFNVGYAIDAFAPRIHLTELWMDIAEYIEVFPEEGREYRFWGTDIYDDDQPLLTVRNGVRTFHDPNWKINTPSVIPPVI